MLKRQLANTGLNISPLGMGTVKLGRNQGVKYPTHFVLPSDKEASDLIALAKELGINLIDTAPAYGNSEERLGKLLKGQRQDWIICSKAGEEFDNSTGQSSYIFTPEHLQFSVERSLKRLDTDYIDMLLIHSDGNDVEIIERYGTLQALNELKTQGKIRASGMSTKTIEGGLLALQQSDCAMVTYNLDHTEEEPVLDYAAQNNKGILLKKALASGHICAASNGDSVQASFDYIFAHPGVTSAIIGTINPEHLRSNVKAAEKAINRK
ncbi:aldo/keto reductase [Neptuniibacter sp. 2_MG-2023]|uniref:aldo/keto reductase n=1 Tax=Neptuniibacter sp. 2_MG-2023 TaxID=3062671 RepID=UPI0026E25DEE|nr:aldo/keto reductase [Neptuniibacter sp. 2_MG-2023]MDO6514991.1 aldo/keto reductase [Neptuniibacter sp. 2_MG-2023]